MREAFQNEERWCFPFSDIFSRSRDVHDDDDDDDNDIYLLGANSTVQFSNAPYNKINYILEYL